MTKDKRIITPEEERDLVASTERGEWRSIGRIEERREFWREAAAGKLDEIRRRDQTVSQLIQEAINARRLLSFTYKSSERSAEPYILGYDDKSNLVLSAVQVEGGSGLGFRSFSVAEMSNVSVMDKRFFGSHSDYNPRDPLFEEVLAKVA
jgi:predicted DNA-binding transcriptional regulator YafY